MSIDIILRMSKAKLEKEVKKALDNSRKGHLSELAASPLGQSALFSRFSLEDGQLTLKGKGWAMLGGLHWGIDQLRLKGSNSRRYQDFHSILYYSYVDTTGSITELIDKLNMTQATFYRQQRSAIKELARIFLAESKTISHQPSIEKEAYLEYTIDAQYNSYAPTEQRLLRLLSLFCAPTPLRLAHQLWGLPREEEPKWREAKAKIQGGIHALIMDGLLRTNDEKTELFVHPDARPYFLTLLTPSEKQAWHEAIARYYAEECAEYVKAARHFRLANRATWAAELLVEHYQDIVEDFKLEVLAEVLPDFRATELSVTLWAELKLVSGQVAEAMKDVSQAVEEYKKALIAPNRLIKAKAYYRLAKVTELINLDEALQYYERAITLLANTPSHQALLVKLLIGSALIYIQERHDLQMAETKLNEAQAVIQLVHQTEHVRLSNTWAAFWHHKKNPQEALQHRWKAWIVAQELQDVTLMLITAHNLALDYDRLGQPEQGLYYLQQSKALAIKTNNRKIEASCDSHIGACHFNLAQYDQAAIYYRQAYDFFVETGNQNWQAHACYNLAELFATLGEHQQKQHYFDEGVEIASTLQDKRLLQEFEELARRFA